MEQIPEELLDLLMACLVFIETKTEKPNPFVRKFGKPDEQDAYELLVSCTNDCTYLIPEVEKLSQTRMQKIKEEEERFISQQSPEDSKEG